MWGNLGQVWKKSVNQLESKIFYQHKYSVFELEQHHLLPYEQYLHINKSISLNVRLNIWISQVKLWSKSVSAGTNWDIYNHFTCVEYKPHFLLCICFPQYAINVASCVILLFTYFHVLLLFMVLNVHHVNLNLLDIPLIIFLFFACCVLVSSCSLPIFLK